MLGFWGCANVVGMSEKNLPARNLLEIAPAPCVLVLFGGTGDLAKRKLYPSLFQLYTRQLLHATSRIVACGRSRHDDDFLKRLVEQSLPQAADSEVRAAFLAMFSYVRVTEEDASTFDDLVEHLDQFDHLDTPTPYNRLYYLAIPPDSYRGVVERISAAGLFQNVQGNGAWRHLMLEKPFGVDYDSAIALDNFLQQHARESQIFRIDHYLGKDTVQNIMVLRFANIFFEPIWNATCIDHVQITVAETLGVEHRAAYYEGAGLLRDMLQNHLLEMLALVAMEPPVEFSSDAIHFEKLALIKAIRALPRTALESMMVRGQYTGGGGMVGYREEPGVNSESVTETFAALKLFIDTPRWRGVPFYLRSGKRLANRTSSIALVFKCAPQRLFGVCQPDALVLQVQPDEGMSLHLQAKRPGPKLRVGELPLSFKYADLGDEMDAPDAYARLLLDAMLHDHTLFVRNDTIAAAWKLFTPVLRAWREHPGDTPLHFYAAGSDGPAAAHELIERDGRAWRAL